VPSAVVDNEVKVEMEIGLPAVLDLGMALGLGAVFVGAVTVIGIGVLWRVAIFDMEGEVVGGEVLDTGVAVVGEGAIHSGGRRTGTLAGGVVVGVELETGLEVGTRLGVVDGERRFGVGLGADLMEVVFAAVAEVET